MSFRTVRIFTVAITAFIPWLLTLSALGAAGMFSRGVFVAVHYALVVLAYGVAFGMYFRAHKGVDPFVVMGIAILSLFVFEFVYLVFLYEGERWFLTWTDWFVPVFLIASTIYWVGKLLK